MPTRLRRSRRFRPSQRSPTIAVSTLTRSRRSRDHNGAAVSTFTHFRRISVLAVSTLPRSRVINALNAHALSASSTLSRSRGLNAHPLSQSRRPRGFNAVAVSTVSAVTRFRRWRVGSPSSEARARKRMCRSACSKTDYNHLRHSHRFNQTPSFSALSHTRCPKQSISPAPQVKPPISPKSLSHA